MSACEICWGRARKDALFRGGTTPEHYERRIAEQEQRPDHEPVSLDQVREER